jgi:hypothetical protein
MKTTTRSGFWTLPRFLLATCLLAGGVGAYRLTNDDPHARVITLAAAWGDGTSATASAHMMWVIGHGTDHEIRGGGHWEKLVSARQGDHIVLTVTPSSPVPASCSITDTRGLNVHGSNRCEVLALP